MPIKHPDDSPEMAELRAAASDFMRGFWTPERLKRYKTLWAQYKDEERYSDLVKRLSQAARDLHNSQ